MNQKTAKRMDNMLPSGIRKINEKALAMERAGESVIHFEIGRPDFDTPEYIKQAGIDSLKAGHVFYTSNYGTLELREAIADKFARENNLSYEAEEILVAVGLSEAVFDVLCSILDEGDEILVPDPVWMNYVNVPRMLGAVPVRYALKEENHFQIDLEEISAKISDKTKAIVIVTPNNPTGGMLSDTTLRGLTEIAIEKDLLVISDEIYERLVYGSAKHISIASYPGMKERTFTLNGFSKAYSMTGWRVGYVAAPKAYLSTINKMHQHNTTCAPSFVQDAAVVALRDETTEVADMVQEYKRRRDYAVATINAIDGISCINPEGAFYIFINIKSLGLSSEEAANSLLDHEHIALVPGSVFGPGGEGYLRLSFATSYDNIVEGCKRLAQGVSRIMHTQQS